LIINALFNALYFRNERAEQLCMLVTSEFSVNMSYCTARTDSPVTDNIIQQYIILHCTIPVFYISLFRVG